MHIVRHPAFRWVITVILLVLMGFQLWSRSDQFQVFRVASWSQLTWYLAAVILLMPVNWFLETWKWHTYLSIHAKVSFGRSFKAVTSGIALSLFTPNRIGEYGGRILFMPYAIRWPVVFSTLMGSMSQNLVAFSAGIISFALLFKGLLFLKIAGFAAVFIAALFYFNMHFAGSVVCRLKVHSFFKKLSNQLSHLKDYSKGILVRTLLLASIRYGIYTLQFVLLLIAFEPGVPVLNLFLGVSCLYFFHTVMPMPPVADVLARTNIALILWSGTGMSELSISLASFIVWMINLLIPAVLGSLAIGTIDLKKAFNTHDAQLNPSYEPALPDQPIVK